jgi:hypothetical protein
LMSIAVIGNWFLYTRECSTIDCSIVVTMLGLNNVCTIMTTFGVFKSSPCHNCVEGLQRLLETIYWNTEYF